MTKQEFATFTAAMKTYFPKESLFPNQQAMELWYMELQDLPYNVAMMALREYVHTSKWSPSIAEIREIAAGVTNGKTPDWGEGWQAVQKAIRHMGMHREEEAMAAMDEITRDAVKRLGYQNLCLSENVTADRARFKDIYEQIAERRKRDAQLPEALRLAIQEAQKTHPAVSMAAEKMKMIGGK